MSEDASSLLARACAGDQNALVELLDRHAPVVRRRLAGKIDPRWQGRLSEDDVMQETYLEAFIAIGRTALESEGAFVAWLGSIAQHNLLDAIKGLKTAKAGGRAHSVPQPRSDESYVRLWGSVQAESSTPSTRAMRDESRQALDQAIRKLPAAYQQIIVMYDLECRSVDDVAMAVQCSAGAVYMRRARALDRLRVIMGSE